MNLYSCVCVRNYPERRIFFFFVQTFYASPSMVCILKNFLAQRDSYSAESAKRMNSEEEKKECSVKQNN